MAKIAVSDWDTTALSNTDLNGGPLGELAMYPAGVNNAFREMMAEVSRDSKDKAGAGHTIGGTANAITVTINQPWPALVDGQLLGLNYTVGPNTGATTITVTNSASVSLGSKKIRGQGDTALTGGEMVDNGIYLLRYVAAYDSAAGAFVLMNPSGGGAPAASTTVAGIVELATDAETQTGTDTARAITPANLTAKEATAANFRANTADRILTTDIVYSAAAEVTLTDAATVAVDMSTFINGIVTLGGNRTLGQPSNTKVGQSGAIRIVQDGTGTRTLAYHADWKFAGSDPVLTTTASATDILFYQVIAANYIYASLVKAVA